MSDIYLLLKSSRKEYTAALALRPSCPLSLSSLACGYLDVHKPGCIYDLESLLCKMLYQTTTLFETCA